MLVATLLGLGAALCAVLAWRHRVELFVIPYLWRQVREMAALRERQPADAAFQPTENRELSRFEVAFSKLVRLQEPGFLGAKDVQLLPMRSEEGRQVYAVRYEPMNVPFDLPPDPDEVSTISFYSCNCAPYTLRALDGAGRLLGEPSSGTVWCQRSRFDCFVVHEEPGAFSTLRLPDRKGCERCRPRRSMALRVLSIDRDGIVDHGFVTDDDLLAPVCDAAPREEPARRAMDDAELARHLGSNLPSDLHRALTELLRAAPEEAVKAEALLSHIDASIRSRAASVMGRVPALATTLAPLLEDTDPRVRFAAIEAVGGTPAGGDLIAPMVSDPHAAVARLACSTLFHPPRHGRAADASWSRPSHRHQGRVRRLLCGESSTALARRVLGWLEEEAAGPDGPAFQWLLAAVFSREQLRPSETALLRVAGQCRNVGNWSHLARALARLDLPSADELLVRGLCSDAPGSHCACTVVLRALWARGTPARVADLERRLLPFLEARAACHGGEWRDSQRAAAFLLLRHGSWKALSWLITSSWSWDDSSWPYEGLLYWVQTTRLEEAPDCPESTSPRGRR